MLPADWGGTDINTLARSEREAYVTADIVHPNLVVRHSFVSDKKRHYAIEESLSGPSLSALAGRGSLGESAIPLILQVARGLNADHEQGITHGDPSLEHMWIDDDIVKLAGLGMAVAEPIGRDGIESFATRSARDLKTLGESLETLAKGTSDKIPPGVQAISRRLKAAGSSEGYRDLNDAIRAMEAHLGVSGDPTSQASPAEMAELAQIAERFHDSPFAGLRTKLLLGFVAICTLFTLLFAKIGFFGMAGTVAGLLILTSIYYGLIIAGTKQHDDLFGRARELMLDGRPMDWIFMTAFKLVVLIALYFLGWLPGAIALSLLSIIFAVGFVVAIDLPISRGRIAAISDARTLLVKIRGRGVSEIGLRAFITSSAGPRWSELFETLFGLEALREVRPWSDQNQAPRWSLHGLKFAILDWLDHRLQARREATAFTGFAHREEIAAVARKVQEMTARRKSKRIAAAIVQVGREVHASSLASLRPPGDAIQVTPRSIHDLLNEAVESPEKLLHTTESEEPEKGPNPILLFLAALVGPRVRFLLGGILLAGFLLWAEQENVISSQQIRDQAEQAINAGDVTKLQNVNIDLRQVQAANSPLILPGIPVQYTKLIVGYGVGAAGLILLISSLVAGWKIALFAIPGAAIAWFGATLGVPSVGPLDGAMLSSAIGGGLLVIGILLARK
jgi:tRNA A-37 threonylcarbamoyl transferase component Bud32